MERFLSLVVIGILVISVAGAFPAVADDNEYDQLVLIRDVCETEDISALGEAGDVIDRYGRYVLLETSDCEIEKLEYNYDIDELENRNQLNIKGHEFNTNEGYPDFDPDLIIEEYDSGTEGLYIVDMIGPISPEWRQELESLGVEVINYQPNYAYEVVMTTEQAEEVKDLFFVDWVGIYQPEFKVAENLQEGNMSIRLVEDANEETIEEINSVVDVHSMTELTIGGERVIAETENLSKLYQIARLKDVYYISNHSDEVQLDGGVGTQITGGGTHIWPPDWEEEDGAFRLEPGSEVGDPQGDYGGEAGSLANQLGYTGENVVVAVADTGLGNGTTPSAGITELEGRVIGGNAWGPADGDWSDGDGISHPLHGTLVTGRLAADTYQGTKEPHPEYKDADENYYIAQGAAPKAEIYAQKVRGEHGAFPDDLYMMFEDAKTNGEAYIHSNSYSMLGEPYKLEFDAAVRDATPSSPGNEPLVILTSIGYGGINPPNDGKNLITVAQTETTYEGPYGGSPENIHPDNAAGWTEDNRIKPDLVAPGPGWSTTFSAYEKVSGNSFSTPTVAGSAAVIVDWYEDQDEYYGKPSPAMVKALLINTAYELDPEEGNTGHIPNEDEGWGMVNLVDLVREDGPEFKLEDQEALIQTGDEHIYVAKPEDLNQPLKISLVWTDKETEEGDDPALKNDLNLKVESPSCIPYRGNAFEEGWTQPFDDTMDDFDTTGDGWDNVNNVQNVYIHPDEVESGNYTIRIKGEDIGADANNDGEENQDYALVVQNAEEMKRDPNALLLRHDVDLYSHGSSDESIDSSPYGTDPDQGTYVYPEGGEVTVEAWASYPWAFTGWTGDYTGSEKTITITVNETKELTAHFKYIGGPPYPTEE